MSKFLKFYLGMNIEQVKQSIYDYDLNDKANPEQEKIGLGLNYCTKVCHLLNNNNKEGLQLHNKEGKGSLLSFTVLDQNYNSNSKVLEKQRFQVSPNKIVYENDFEKYFNQNDSLYQYTTTDFSILKKIEMDTNLFENNNQKNAISGNSNIIVIMELSSQQIKTIQNSLKIVEKIGDISKSVQNYNVNQTQSEHTMKLSQKQNKKKMKSIKQGKSQTEYQLLSLIDDNDNVKQEDNIGLFAPPHVSKTQQSRIYFRTQLESEIQDYQPNYAYKQLLTEKSGCSSPKKQNSETLEKGAKILKFIQKKEPECSCTKVLMVDDDIFCLKSMQKIFQQRYDLNIDFASNGQKGLEKVQQKYEQNKFTQRDCFNEWL
ncbi:hypothetical protein PPERSA_07106 [Pseudocohnilembus persalinus]|uniref:Response regulatory domain-containing protein n=1 Tax=Pseudocohnilembus persalinus TaxID=266149 RepID=A0A0V0QXA3_PSEPJ|nr:hypothetical protein PPERSA_07106 [Pseudocohnilembus persalinus]|eukprot:KRX06943.1 hypothetical protein PPERSA_07106 [Pseudocohnilembus persalinus]